MEEVELIKRVQSRDVNAFEELYELYKYQSIRMIFLITGNKEMSEDIVQEAFLVCFFSITNVKEPKYFRVWFFKLLKRIAWRYVKQNNKYNLTNDLDIFIDIKTKVNELEEKTECKIIHEEILKLDYKLRMTLILYYYNDFSIKEISKVMGCLEGTVKSRLYNGRKKLKCNLERQEYLVGAKEDLSYGN